MLFLLAQKAALQMRHMRIIFLKVTNKTNKNEFNEYKKHHCSGGFSGEVIPDPIPNSEVKLTSADGTWA